MTGAGVTAIPEGIDPSGDAAWVRPGTHRAEAPPAGGPTGEGGPPSGLLGFARELDAALARVAEAPAWAMTTAEQAEALRVLHRAECRLAELELRVLAAADRNQVGAATGATSTGVWLATETVQTRAAGVRAVRLALALDEEFSATRAALAAGACDVEQAQVIVTAVRRLVAEHDDLPAGTHLTAEAHLLDLATRFDAADLRRLGKRLFEVICPEAADAVEGERLEQEEKRARRRAYLSLHDNGDGTVEGRFRLPVAHAELLRKAVDAVTSPRRLGEARLDPETGSPLPAATVRGLGLMDLLENHLDTASMPTQQGGAFTLVITMGLDALLSGIGVATLETGGRISAGEARRLAAHAGLIPMVLGTDSVPLDLGRESRGFTRYQRLAMAHVHGGCATAGCDMPPAWVEAHHPEPWRHGGRTDLDNGLPLCPPHHHMADHPRTWTMTRLPSGGVRFSRRQ